MTHDPADHVTREFWERRYAESQRIWSGEPNPRLVEHAAGLAPGTALDVGCGEGADVVWLASRGWQVTGVDVSQVALDRARAHAQEAGVLDRVALAQVDLMTGNALPQADLVSAQFLHVPPGRFAEVYAVIAAAVRPGGTLLVTGHHPADAATGLRNPELTLLLFTPEQVTALLDPRAWTVRVAAAPTREATDREGRPVTVTDSVVVATRA